MCLRFIACLVCLFLIFPCQAQKYLVDSIRNALEEEDHAHARLDLYLGIARLCGFSSEKQLRPMVADSALHLAQKLGNFQAEVYARSYLLNEVYAQSNNKYDHFDRLSKLMDFSRQKALKDAEAFLIFQLSDLYASELNELNTSIRILEDFLAEGTKGVSTRNKGYIYQNLAYNLFLSGENEAALQHFDTALALFESLQKSPPLAPGLGRTPAIDWDKGTMGKGMTLVYMGRVYTRLGKFDMALEHINQAEQYFTAKDCPDFHAWVKEEAARVYEYQGDFSEAIKNLQYALQAYIATQSTDDLKYIYRDIAHLFYKMDATESSKENFEKAYAFSVKDRDTTSIIENLGWLGMIALNEGKAQSAFDFRKKALELSMITQDSISYPWVYTGMAEAYDALGKTDQAIDFYKQAWRLNQYFENKLDMQSSLNKLLSLYLRIDQLDSARYIAGLATANAKSYANLDQQRFLALKLSQLEEKSGNLEAALAHHKEYAALFLSVYTEKAQALQKNEEIRQNVAGVTAEKEKAEREKELLNNLNQLYIGLSLALLIILALGAYLFFKLRQNKSLLEEKNTELRQLNTTKDRFFGIIAHDLRNPLIALEWVSEQMNMYIRRQDTDKLYRLAEQTEGTAKNLSTLLDNLLNWSLVQTGSIPYQPEQVGLSALIDNILSLYQPLAEAKEIKLTNEIPPELCAYADTRAVHMIVRNLVGNALKFTPNEGRIKISHASKNGHQQVIVSDTGRGISPDVLPKLFSLDKKIHIDESSTKGTGLGLMLCRELVELNKGKIDVQSQPGQGTQFIVSLPQA